MPITVKVTLSDSTVIQTVLPDAYLESLAREQYARQQRANAEKAIGDRDKAAVTKVEVV